MINKETVTLMPGQTIIGTKYTKSNYVERLEKENAELKAENKRLKLSERDLSRICQDFKKDIETEKSYVLKYYKTLQEIKDIAEMDICSNCITQKREDNCQCLADTILQKITKAESEEV